ncbi:MAG: hypothetical protein QXE42_02410 [Candidatus Aenigmatarchaeota archaeon]
MENLERLYFISIIKLRRSLPKFILLCIFFSIVLLFSKFVFIPLSKELPPLANIQISNIISFIATVISASILVLTIREMNEISDAVSDISSYFLNIRKTSSRNRLRRSMKVIIFVIFSVFLFWLFKDFLESINPALSGIIIILITIIAFLSFYGAIYTLLLESEINIRKFIVSSIHSARKNVRLKKSRSRGKRVLGKK